MTKATGWKKAQQIIKKRKLRNKLDTLRARLDAAIDDLLGLKLDDKDVYDALEGPNRLTEDLSHAGAVGSASMLLECVMLDVRDAAADLDAKIAALQVKP